MTLKIIITDIKNNNWTQFLVTQKGCFKLQPNSYFSICKVTSPKHFSTDIFQAFTFAEFSSQQESLPQNFNISTAQTFLE
jgi:hypothetical protein